MAKAARIAKPEPRAWPDWVRIGLRDSGILGSEIEAALGMELNEQTDPVEFAEKALGIRLWSRQVEVLRALIEHPKVAVPSAHEQGKSFLAALFSVYWLQTRTPAYVITTAPTHRQVKSILWREIRAMWAKLPECLRKRGEVQELSIKMHYDGSREINPMHYAYGFSSDKPDALSGEHKEHMLVVLDEGCGIPDELEAVIDTWGAEKTFAPTNPTNGEGWLYHACTDRELGWHVVKLSALDSPNWTGEDCGDFIKSRLLKREQAEVWKRKHGENSTWYRSRVLAEFPDMSSRQVIAPSMWFDLACEREYDQRRATKKLEIGVDPSGSGTDRTCIAVKTGARLLALYSYDGVTTTQDVIGWVRQVVNEWSGGYDFTEVKVDATGVGAGVADLLAANSSRVVRFIPVHFGSKSNNAQLYENWRAEAYWSIRQALDPQIQSCEKFTVLDALKGSEALESLQSQLSDIRWEHSKVALRIVIEPKAKMRERKLHSPDEADALALAFGQVEEPVEQDQIVYAGDVLSEMGYQFEQLGIAGDEDDG